MIKNSITQGKLKDLLKYDPDTGIFRWAIKRWRAEEGDIAGSPHPSFGYRSIKIEQQQYKAHRLAFLYMLGYFPKYTDHINGDRDDNRWVNLREVTCSENAKNQKLRAANRFSIHGIRISPSGRYVARITVDYKDIRLGTFNTLDEAISSRKNAESKYGFHINHGRNPSGENT